MKRSVGNCCVQSVFLFFLPLFFLSAPVSSAAEFDPGVPPLEESWAFKQFAIRPRSDLSVLIYLIDRFKEAKIKIVYGGNYFDAPFAANIARWFLKARYQGENPREWIHRWCDRDIITGKPIWVKDARGEFKMSRDVLMDELKALEAGGFVNLPPAVSPKS